MHDNTLHFAPRISTFEECMTRTASISKIIKQHCLDIEWQFRKTVSKGYHEDNLFNDDQLSDRPENQMHMNNYQTPSYRNVHGSFVFFKPGDVRGYEFLFQHCVFDDNSVLFVYLPSFTQKSNVTGNIHRLSYNVDASCVITQQLRFTQLQAVISLARILFPWNDIPLTNAYKIKFYGSPRMTTYANPLPGVYTVFSNNFEISKRHSRRFSCLNKQIYRLSRIIVNSINPQHAQTHMLQNALVEYNIERASRIGSLSQRMKWYIQFYKQNLNLIFFKLRYA